MPAIEQVGERGGGQMKDASQFPSKRVCCICRCEATGGRKKRVPGEPNILAITPVIYRRGSGKGQLRNAPKIVICETCMVYAVTSSGWKLPKESKSLWEAIRESISYRYSAMAEGDSLQEKDAGLWASIRASLPFPSSEAKQ